MASMSFTARLASHSSRHPWRSVLIWVGILILAGAIQAVAPLNTTTDFKLLNNPESQQGWDLLEEHGIRQERPATETVIIQSGSTTVDDPAFQTVVQNVTNNLRADPEIVANATNFIELNAQTPGSGDGLISGDRKTTIIPVTLTGSLEDATSNGDEYLDLVHAQ